MPSFVIERQYLVPMYQHIVVEAETLEEACKKGISDDIDWDTQEMDCDSARAKVVLGAGDAEQMRELVDHQPDRGILADAFGVYVFVVPHLAAGMGDRQRNAARVAGAGVDDHQRVAEAVAMGAFCFRHGDVSVKERGCS